MGANLHKLPHSLEVDGFVNEKNINHHKNTNTNTKFVPHI